MIKREGEDPLQYTRRNRHWVDPRESDIIDASSSQSSSSRNSSRHSSSAGRNTDWSDQDMVYENNNVAAYQIITSLRIIVLRPRLTLVSIPPLV